MKTAKAIEETLRENLDKIEKNTAAKPRQRYLTFGNVIAFALAILVIWVCYLASCPYSGVGKVAWL